MTAKSSPAAQGTMAPCPFCGSAAKMISCMGAWNVNGYEPDGRRIVCSADNCYGVGKPFYGDGMEEAATAWWNNRPASPSPEALPASGVEVVRLRQAISTATAALAQWQDEYHDCDCPAGQSCGCREFRNICTGLECVLIGEDGSALTSAPAPEDRTDG